MFASYDLFLRFVLSTQKLLKFLLFCSLAKTTHVFVFLLLRRDSPCFYESNRVVTNIGIEQPSPCSHNLSYGLALARKMASEPSAMSSMELQSVLAQCFPAVAVGFLPWKIIELPHGELAAPTNDINTTVALALLTSAAYLRARGILIVITRFYSII